MKLFYSMESTLNYQKILIDIKKIIILIDILTNANIIGIMKILELKLIKALFEWLQLKQ